MSLGKRLIWTKVLAPKFLNRIELDILLFIKSFLSTDFIGARSEIQLRRAQFREAARPVTMLMVKLRLECLN
jgi:hypothetical protein